MRLFKTLRIITALFWTVIILLLITATILEKFYGTTFIYNHVYGSIWFVTLWGMATIISLVYMWHCKLHKQPVKWLMHISFVIILIGGLITYFMGERGVLELHESEIYDFFTNEDGEIKALPFTVQLEQFDIEYYVGTNSPADYVSRLIIFNPTTQELQKASVSMNQIFVYNGYRFYQSGYDENEQGSILMIYHDPYGIMFTYIGYGLLLITILLFLLTDFKYHMLFKALQQSGRKTYLLLLLLLIPPYLEAKTPQVLPKEVATQFGDLYVLYNGRVCPLQTLAKDFTIKLYGKDHYKGFTAEQVFTGWIFFYNDWKNQPMIKLKNGDIQKLLEADSKYASFIDYRGKFNEYKLDDLVKEIHQGKPVNNSAAILAADEKFNLIVSLYSSQLMKIYPYLNAINRNKVEWISQGDRIPDTLNADDWFFIKKSWDYIYELILAKNYNQLNEALDKIKIYQEKNAGYNLPSTQRIFIEKAFNQLSSIKILAMIALALGIALFGYYCFLMIKQQNFSSYIMTLSMIVVFIMWLYLSLIIAFRWYIGEHIPLSNGPETMQFMAWCALLFALLICKKYQAALPFGVLISGLTLLVAMMGHVNPPITKLVPVLSSPLLSIHVATIMLAYVFLAFITLNSILAIILHAVSYHYHVQINQLYLMSKILLYPAVFLLAMGIFIGAVWANVSWGRYWGWDPKEVWALITLLIYSIAFHQNSIKQFQKPIFFHLFCLMAFLSVIITYFGVNYILGGIHSYA